MEMTGIDDQVNKIQFLQSSSLYKKDHELLVYMVITGIVNQVNKIQFLQSSSLYNKDHDLLVCSEMTCIADQIQQNTITEIIHFMQ